MSLRSALLVTAASLVGVALAATVQAAPSEVIDVKVPFNFVAGGQTFPAGTYIVDVGTATDPELVTIESQDGLRAELFFGQLTTDSREGSAPQLEFKRIGGRYYLVKVDQGNGKRDFGVPGAPVGRAVDQRTPAAPAPSTR